MVIYSGMHRLTDEQIKQEYIAIYGPREPTPLTHPQLFDPLNPPVGYAYDEWHAFWYQIPSEQAVKFELWFVKMSLWVTLGLMLWTAISYVSS